MSVSYDFFFANNYAWMKDSIRLSATTTSAKSLEEQIQGY